MSSGRITNARTTSKKKGILDLQYRRPVIGKYAAENGNASALKKFKASKPGLIESTVRSFKQNYVSLLQEKRATNDTTPITTIASKKRGRPLTLGELDHDVQKYVKAMREAGAPVSTYTVIAAARGIVNALINLSW